METRRESRVLVDSSKEALPFRHLELENRCRFCERRITDVLDKFAGSYVKPVSQLNDVEQADVSLSTLDFAHVVAVQVG
jgi:hypothetical protein